MTRILFWLALAFLVLMALRSKFKSARSASQSQNVTPRPNRPLAAPEVMLACAHCGVYYPASETVQARGRDYCSDAHASQP